MFKDVRDVRKLASELTLLESKVKLYEEELINLRSTRYTFDSIIGKSEAIKTLKLEALSAASNHFPVLITGSMLILFILSKTTELLLKLLLTEGTS